MTSESGIIIVSGSNGRIGDAVMRRLAGRLTDVAGFDRKAPSPPPEGRVYVPVEITSEESVRDGLRIVLYAAGYGGKGCANDARLGNVVEPRSLSVNV